VLDRSTIVAVLRRPALWGTALAALAAMAPQHWWRQRPFLPIPQHELVEWRLTTAYGTPDTTLAAADLVAYLEWRQAAARGSGG